MTMIAAGFLLGVASSLHCVAMCGPLMSAVLGGRRGRARVVYHGARVTSYAALGLLTGAVGQVAVLAGAGRVLSVVVGLALIWAAAVRLGVPGSSGGVNWRASSASHASASHLSASNARASEWSGVGLAVGSLSSIGVSRYISGAIGRAARVARSRWSDASLSGIAAAGVLNGLLPCGAVYAALATAASLGDARLSPAFMLAFGAGTLPAVTVAGELVARFARAGGTRWAKAAPAALALVGLLLTARGLMPSHHHEASSPAHDLSEPSTAPTPSHSAHGHAAAHR